MKCRYKVIFIGKCGKDSGLHLYCSKHKKKKCKCCGEQAIGECTYVGKDAMCCAPTCRKDLLCLYHVREIARQSGAKKGWAA